MEGGGGGGEGGEGGRRGEFLAREFPAGHLIKRAERLQLQSRARLQTGCSYRAEPDYRQAAATERSQTTQRPQLQSGARLHRGRSYRAEPDYTEAAATERSQTTQRPQLQRGARLHRGDLPRGKASGRPTDVLPFSPLLPSRCPRPPL